MQQLVERHIIFCPGLLYIFTVPAPGLQPRQGSFCVRSAVSLWGDIRMPLPQNCGAGLLMLGLLAAASRIYCLSQRT